jgi:hypothetical protein
MPDGGILIGVRQRDTACWVPKPVPGNITMPVLFTIWKSNGGQAHFDQKVESAFRSFPISEQGQYSYTSR